MYDSARTKRFQFTSADGLSIACVKWSGHHHVRGVVQIAHGLGEHTGRYAELAETLVQGEFVVYGSDHRGHGLTAKRAGSFGDFGADGFDQLVEYMVSLRVIAKRQHPGKPYILLGHSMGSFAAQQFILDHSHSINGLVLSGSGTLDGLARLGQSSSAGEDPMRLMNVPFEPARTPSDWLSRDNAEVDAFIADPLRFPSLKVRSMESFVAFARLADPRVRLTYCRINSNRKFPSWTSASASAAASKPAASARGNMLASKSTMPAKWCCTPAATRSDKASRRRSAISSLANAVSNALGVEVTKLPLRPEYIMELVHRGDGSV